MSQEAHCATCSCVPGMAPAIRFDTTPAEKEGAARDHLIRMGWTPPAEAQAQGGGEVRAKPLEWQEDRPGEWCDRHHGFHITRDEDWPQENSFIASWGEGDVERFTTLEEAQAWCQEELDRYIREWAVTAPPSAPVGVEGTWLWSKLMDWCREQRIAPATQDKLFAIAGEAHRLNALAQQPQPAAEVYVDFPQVGTAGPLAVVDGRVTLPDATMNDLIRHARTGYVEQPAAVDESMKADAEELALIAKEIGLDDPLSERILSVRTRVLAAAFRNAQQPAACRCMDCGGDQPGHDPHCSYMSDLHGGSDNDC